jgi:hypothetical protein
MSKELQKFKNNSVLKSNKEFSMTKLFALLSLLMATSVFAAPARVMVSGYLPNLCYKAPRAEYKIAPGEINIKLTAMVESSNTICAEMAVPFLESVAVGTLNKGNYTVNVNKGSPYSKSTAMKVFEPRSNSLDEFTYASVDYVKLEQSSRVAVLNGYNPSDCFVLDKVEIVSNKKNTYSVLPIMKQIRDFCPMKMIPFEYPFMVPQDLTAEKVLLHVRSMDGRSVNTIYNQQN